LNEIETKNMLNNTSALEALAIGIDIGGTGTKFGIVDRVGNVLFSSEKELAWAHPMETIIQEPLSTPPTFLGRALFHLPA